MVKETDLTLDTDLTFYKVEDLPITTYIADHGSWLCAYVVAPAHVDLEDATWVYDHCTWCGPLPKMAAAFNLPKNTIFLGVDTNHLQNTMDHTERSPLDAIQQIATMIETVYPKNTDTVVTYRNIVNRLNNSKLILTAYP